MKRDRYLPARLLSGKDGLSVLEKEQILEQVLDASAVGAETGSAWFQAPALRWATGLAAVLIAIPLAWTLLSEPTEPEFLARGGSVSSPVLTLRCVGSRPGTGCHPGDKLLFRITPQEGKPFFSAFSRRPDGTVIWYFPGPGADQRSIDVRRQLTQGVLSVGIRLGPEHLPGRYDVHGLFSEQPLNRDRIRAVFEEPQETIPGLVVLDVRSFEVEAP